MTCLKIKVDSNLKVSTFWSYFWKICLSLFVLLLIMDQDMTILYCKLNWTIQAQCLIWHYKLHQNLLVFLSKSQFSEKFPSTFWRVFWCMFARPYLLQNIWKKTIKKTCQNIACNYFIFFTFSQVQTNPIFDGICHF